MALTRGLSVQCALKTPWIFAWKVDNNVGVYQLKVQWNQDIRSSKANEKLFEKLLVREIGSKVIEKTGVIFELSGG